MSQAATEPKPAAAVLRSGKTDFWRMLERVAGLFTLAVGVALCTSYVQAKREDPLNSPRLAALKEQLRETPTSEPLKQQIRKLDLALRERYFHNMSRIGSGVWLLLASGAVLLFATASTTAGKHSYDFLRTRSDDKPRSRTPSLQGVAMAGIATAVFMGWLAWSGGRTPLPSTVSQVDKLLTGGSETDVPDYAPAAELQKNWPRFRGPGGNGLDVSGQAPASWDAASGAGIAWKVPCPVPGFNSPLVFGDYVYLSGGDASKLEVLCFRLSNGEIVWRKPVEAPGAAARASQIPDSTGFAPSTMATDGRRVYAIFASGILGAFSLNGTPAWTKDFGTLSNPYGHAISLATYQDRLIVQLDQGDSSEGKSTLYALNGRSGRPVWQKARAVGASWASPIVIEAAGKPQIITLAVPHAIAYLATDGTELWRAECLNGEVTPSPIFAGGSVIVASPSERVVAIRPDGTGDVTKTHLTWSSDENVPDVTSPVSNGELVFYVTTSGMLTCLDLKDGKKLWEHDLNFECHASPAISGNRLYQFGQNGTGVIVETAREYKELFRGTFPDGFHASPAFCDQSIILRGITNLWRIAASGPAQKTPAKTGGANE